MTRRPKDLQRIFSTTPTSFKELERASDDTLAGDGTNSREESLISERCTGVAWSFLNIAQLAEGKDNLEPVISKEEG